jgi:hypothetical protein
MSVVDVPQKIHAAIMLRAVCDTALERFDDDDLEDLRLSNRVGELRDLLDGYLSGVATRFVSGNGHAAP